MLKLSSHFAVLCLFLIVASPLVLASAVKPPKPPLLKRLWVQAYSAGAVLGEIAIEGIHVKESIVGPFNLLVVYDMIRDGAGFRPVPRKLFVDRQEALYVLQLVFDGSTTVREGSVIVEKVGLTAIVRMDNTNLNIQALRPVKPSNITFGFVNTTSHYAFNVTGMQLPAIASGFVDPSLWSGTGGVLPVQTLGFLVPEARIKLTYMGPGTA